MQEFLIKHASDLWLAFALALLAIQIYLLSNPKLLIISIAAGFVAVFVELGMLDRDKFHHAIIAHLIISASSIILFVPIIKYFHNKRHLVTEEPIGDYAHIHSENLTKSSIGEISWHGFIKKAVIDPRENATEFLCDQKVIISDCMETVFYVVSSESIDLINSTDNK